MIPGLDKKIQTTVHSHRVLLRLLPYFFTQKRLVAIVMICLLANAASQTAVPWLVKIAIDEFIRAGDLSGLTWFFVIFIGNAVLGWGSNVGASVSLHRATQNVLYDLRSTLVSHLQNQSVSFFDKNSVGGLMSRVLGDVDAIQELFLGAWILGPVLHLIGISIAVLILDLKLGLIAMSVVPVLILFVVVWQPYVARAFAKHRHAEADFSKALNENLAGIRVVQSMNRQKRTKQILKTLNRRNLQTALFARRLSVLRHTPRGILQGLSIGLAVFLGGLMVSSNALELGTYVAFALYIQRFFQPLHTVLAMLTPFNQAMASGTRVFELLDTRSNIDQTTYETMAPSSGKGQVEFRNVSYSYTAGRKTLTDINLMIKPDEMVAIVGPTGAGKTTLISLLSKFYDLSTDDGAILLDGHDIRGVNRSWLATQIAVVLQDPFLFSGTVRENIKYNRQDITDARIVEAAKAVGIHNFIMELENNYDSFLTDGGINLSLGQRQQLCFTRALVRNPRILVLDEATSRLDSTTDDRIQQILLQQHRTCIVIAHRLSTIQRADKIVVLNHGEVVEVGTHFELIHKAGLYARLYKMNVAALEGFLPTTEHG